MKHWQRIARDILRSQTLLLFLVFMVLSLLSLETTIGTRLQFVVLWAATGLIPGWCVAIWLTDDDSRLARAAYAVLFSLTIPPALLYAGSVLLGSPISLNALYVVAAIIILLTLFSPLFMKRYDKFLR